MGLVCILLGFGSVHISRAFQVGCGSVWNAFVGVSGFGEGRKLDWDTKSRE